MPQGQGEGGRAEGEGERVLLQEGVRASAWILLAGGEVMGSDGKNGCKFRTQK